MDNDGFKQRLARFLDSSIVPHGFVAAQLRKPTGAFGRQLMTRLLNRGNEELIVQTLDVLALRRDDVFMDVGFGGGLALELAMTRTSGPLWGVDYSGDMVHAGMRRFGSAVRSGRLNLVCADVTALPLRDALVSAVCSTNTVYFWPDPPAAFLSLHRVLRPGGRVTLGYSGARKMREFGQVTGHGFTLYEPDAVEQLARDAGFAQVHTHALEGGSTRGDYVSLLLKA